MNIEALNLFIRSTELGNITAAGRELGLGPSVASHKLAKLEDHLGMRLLHRTTRQVSLTEDGAVFLPHAIRVRAAVDEAYGAAVKGVDVPKRVLRVCAPGSFARMCLVPIITRFLHANPHLKIDLILSDEIQDLTEIGIDVAIRIAALKDSSQVARRIGSDLRLLCAAPAYLEAHGEPMSPADLINHSCILLGDEDHWRFIGVPPADSAEIDGALRVNCGESARLAAVAGLGIASISMWNAQASLVSRSLVEVMPSHALEQTRDIWAIYPSARLISSKARAFVEFIIAEFQGGICPVPVQPSSRIMIHE